MPPREDTLPWYRQFWPWFIIALPATAVVASLYTVSLAFRSTDSLVTGNDDGVENIAEQHLKAERSAVRLGIAADVDIDVNSGAVVATLHSTEARSWPATLNMQFSHPTHASRDLSVELTRAPVNDDGQPVWSGHFLSVPDGRWYVVLESGGDWRLNGTWTGQARLQLLAASAKRR